MMDAAGAHPSSFACLFLGGKLMGTLIAKPPVSPIQILGTLQYHGP